MIKNEGDFTRFIVGRVMDVLIEQPVKGKDDVYEGYTRNYVKVEVKGIEENLKGLIVTFLFHKSSYSIIS